MPRKNRVVIANYPHHVVHRGHNRDPVFFSNNDRLSYLETLRELRVKLDLQVYGYCLMTNHVHLIVNPVMNVTAISLLMKHLAARHTRRINRLMSRTGTCWDGRFHCSPIESDRYLLACTRYVDLNPVRAGLVSEPEDHPWSSYRAHAGLNHCQWLDPDPCYLALGATPAQRCERYSEFVAQGIEDTELEFIRGAVNRNQLTGSEEFVEEFERHTGQRVLHRKRGRPMDT
jgi:putative transposase